MTSQQQSRIKGGLLRARFLYVALKRGADCWASVLNRLPDAYKKPLEDIAVDQWYPLALLDQVDRAVAAEIRGSAEEVFADLGEFSATTSLQGPYRSLLDPDIHSFLAQSAFIHRAYQDFGQAGYDRTGETSGRLFINYDSPPPVSFCFSGAAYFRRAIELCGARSARITHSRCASAGGGVCEFYITWQP